MPELPEVQTVVDGLNKKIKGKTILSLCYCDAKKLIREPSFGKFEKEIKNRKIEKVERRAKNILIFLSGEKILAIHLKMTGHFILIKNEKSLQYGGQVKIKNGKWIGEDLSEELRDPKNQFIRLVFELSGGLILAYSDLRKFGEIRLVNHSYLSSIDSKLGPEPLPQKFDLNLFRDIIGASKGKIKAVLLDQKRISGIGNIYADEILFEAGVRPQRPANSLSKKEIERIFYAIKNVLKRAIDNRGTSDSDFRDVEGKRGNNQNSLFVYRRTGKECFKCGGKVKRIKISQRGTHYCENCQK